MEVSIVEWNIKKSRIAVDGPYGLPYLLTHVSHYAVFVHSYAKFNTLSFMYSYSCYYDTCGRSKDKSSLHLNFTHLSLPTCCHCTVNSGYGRSEHTRVVECASMSGVETLIRLYMGP